MSPRARRLVTLAVLGSLVAAVLTAVLAERADMVDARLQATDKRTD